MCTEAAIANLKERSEEDMQRAAGTCWAQRDAHTDCQAAAETGRMVGLVLEGGMNRALVLGSRA